jgi:hypothetical protein
MRDLVIYVGIENVVDELDRFNVTAFHGYIVEGLVPKNTKKPNGIEVTDKGYFNPKALKANKASICSPDAYIDGYYTSEGSYYDALYKFIEKLFRMKQKYKIENILLKTDNVEVGRIIKSAPNELVEIFNGYYGNRAHHLVRYLSELKLSILRVYSGSTGLDQVTFANNVAKHHKRDYHISLSDAKTYWTPKRLKEDLIISRHVVFKNIPDEHVTYCFCNYKKDDAIGLQTNYVSYYQLYTEEKIREFEHIRRLMRKLLGDNAVICTINSELVYDKTGVRLMSVFGNDSMLAGIKKGKAIIRRPDGTVIASEIKPVGIAGAAQGNCDVVGTVMRDYVKMFRDKPHRLRYTELTDTIWDNGKIRKEVGNGHIIVKEIRDDFIRDVKSNKTYKLKLVTGIDVVDRNTLKRVEKKDPVLYLAINQISDTIFEYYTVLHLRSEDKLIVWTNIYSNKLPFKKL